MRTAVYGGSFNPIHRGHVHILGEFMDRLGLDRALLVPAGVPPHKQAPDLAPAEDRLAMCRLAAKELSGRLVEVSDVELNRPGRSFTSDTLALLHEQYPGDELFLLMGEDMFLTVDQWHEAGEILRRAVLCAAPRSPQGLERLREKSRALEALGARCAVEDISFLDVSSTQVRELARRGEDLSPLAPEAVAEYIRRHGIYGYTGGGRHEV